MYKIKENLVSKNNDKILYNIMKLLEDINEKLSDNKPNKAIKKEKGTNASKELKNTDISKLNDDTSNIDKMTRKELFAEAKKHKIDKYTTMKTEELRKILKEMI